MLIGGLQKFSLLDYPGKLSAIVFTQGCNFRCQFCYNPRLVWPVRDGKLKYSRGLSGGEQKVHPNVIEDDFFVFLKSRTGKLDAVVITGGEPCSQKDLAEFIKKIKELGFLIKLDTNGSYPEILARLIKAKPLTPNPSPTAFLAGEGNNGVDGARLVDYIAMDLKAPEDKYEEVTGVKINFNKIKKSVKIIRASGLPYEFRTTVVPELLDKDDIGEMGKIIIGADFWYLQNFKSRSDLVNQKLKGRVPYNARQMNEMVEIGRKYVKRCEVR